MLHNSNRKESNGCEQAWQILCKAYAFHNLIYRTILTQIHIFACYILEKDKNWEKERYLSESSVGIAFIANVIYMYMCVYGFVCASWLHEKPEKSFNFCQTNRPLQINGTRMSNQIFHGLFVENKEHKEMAKIRNDQEQEMAGMLEQSDTDWGRKSDRFISSLFAMWKPHHNEHSELLVRCKYSNNEQNPKERKNNSKMFNSAILCWKLCANMPSFLHRPKSSIVISFAPFSDWFSHNTFLSTSGECILLQSKVKMCVTIIFRVLYKITTLVKLLQELNENEIILLST